MVAMVGDRKISADAAPSGLHLDSGRVYFSHMKDTDGLELLESPSIMYPDEMDQRDAAFTPAKKSSMNGVYEPTGDGSEDDAVTTSTRSSYLESSPYPDHMFSRPSSSDEQDFPLQSHANLGESGLGCSFSSIVLEDSTDGGHLNLSFSSLPEHVEAGLPSVDAAEDVTIAPKLHGGDGGPTIIDALVREDIKIGKEGLKALVLQIFIPFILAGFGMVAAGIVLDKVQAWPVFAELTEIFIMVPALLGLKGNLEMTLASRLSTQVNIGGFEDPKRKWRIIGCNVALNQVLASGVGFLASVFAVIVYAINHSGEVLPKNIVLLLGIALISACSTSVVQDSVMIFIVLLAKRYRLNPDNIATPVAGTIGDILTLGILVGFSLLFYSVFKTNYWMVGPAVTIALFVLLLPMWIFIARKEPTTRHVLLHGWLPVIVAMIVSSCAGIILERVLSSGLAFFKGLLVFQPLINGVGGNIVSVQASRIATYLHIAYMVPGHVPPGYSFCRAPCQTFCSLTSVNARTARLLLLMVVPGHLIFMFVISFAHAGSTSVTLRFAVVFLVLALVQVTTLLYIADVLTHFVWKKALDPDSTTIPYLTALGDLLGTGLLALGFYLLWVTGNKNADVGD